jgi:thiamine phosphate synthase YjbQ (UPF0047 family)
MSLKKPLETTVEVRPEARFDVVDMRQLLPAEHRDFIDRYARTLYASHHTTAGYLDTRIAERLGHDEAAIRTFLGAFKKAFPPQAGYHHDQLERRTELSEAQKATEPLNADSHLTFISAGLVNCVAPEGGLDDPVWWVELDGVFGPHRRTRRATIIGYDDERAVAGARLPVEVAAHGFDAVNLRDPELGLYDKLQQMVDASGIRHGRLDVVLAPDEQSAGLTVNEYETLLMKQDLKEVLADPVRHMASKGRHMLADPRSIPGKTLSYARYDVPHLLQEALNVLGLSDSVVERVLGRLMAIPASRFLRVKRSVSLPVVTADDEGPGRARILQGTYQSPILVQWQGPGKTARHLDVTLVELR